MSFGPCFLLIKFFQSPLEYNSSSQNVFQNLENSYKPLTPRSLFLNDFQVLQTLFHIPNFFKVPHVLFLILEFLPKFFKLYFRTTIFFNVAWSLFLIYQIFPSLLGHISRLRNCFQLLQNFLHYSQIFSKPLRPYFKTWKILLSTLRLVPWP
jgi:hypothetical protein